MGGRGRTLKNKKFGGRTLKKKFLCGRTWEDVFSDFFFCGRTWEDVGGRGRTQHDFVHLRPPTSSHLEVTLVEKRGRTWEDAGGHGRTWEDLGGPI